MRDITDLRDQMLVTVVFNDCYYLTEIQHRAYLVALLREDFVFTAVQLEALHCRLDREGA